MFFQRLKTPGLGHNSYVVGCGEGLAVVIDPRRDVDDYLRLARENDLSIAYVLETHRQEDFEFGTRTLAQMTGARVVGGSHALLGEMDVKLEDEEELKVGTTRFVALETPGHTPESMSYAVYVKDAGDKCWGVFTGDALFVGDTGRTDLPDPEKTGENAGILYDSVHRKIAPLGDHTLLFPAHGAGSACGGNISERDDSTLGIEKGTNPVFSKNRRDFVAHKLAEKMARPPYFKHLEKVNLLLGRPIKWPSTVKVLQPREFQHRMKEGLVIDTRSPEAFSAAHIPGAYNIWLEGVPAFGGWVASENTRIFLVADGSEAMELAVLSLARIGIDTVEGVLAKSMESWRDEGLPIESIATTSASETANWMQQGRVHVLDVRDQYEWDEKHIPGAVHCYVGYLEDKLPLLPKDSEIVVHCNVGHRSGVAASILKRHGFTRIHNMLGGITAWEKLGLPLEKSDEAKRAD
ncbi:MAG: MBL fold metallo-hydrolase [Rhodoferax sp.]